jgi:hypothetical protein
MELPFSQNDFFYLFKIYNNNIFSFEIFLYLLGIISLTVLITRYSARNLIISSVLAIFWLWNGVVYHLMYFTKINKAAYIFGIVFILQGLIFFYHGIIRNKFNFEFSKSVKNIFGLIVILYGIVFYSVLGYFFGHIYPFSPVFGAAPCPTVIFTWGILLMNKGKSSFIILIIPAIWSIIGTTAAFKLGVIEDYGLIISAVTSIILILTLKNKLLKANN